MEIRSQTGDLGAGCLTTRTRSISTWTSTLTGLPFHRGRILVWRCYDQHGRRLVWSGVLEGPARKHAGFKMARLRSLLPDAFLRHVPIWRKLTFLLAGEQGRKVLPTAVFPPSA